jgi:glycosyltransferase involved in cell wall biosynthesis
MKNSLSFVSIIIPCRNEEEFIAKCLDSIISQDYPKESFEVLVIDGMSEDKTRAIIDRYKMQNTRNKVRLLENPQKYTPFGLNIGLKSAKGDLIIRMDAHASYQKDYISKCVKYSKECNADNVGGAIKTLPAKNNLISKSIASCLSSSFGAGSSFRLGAKRIKEADTVFGGCYKKEVFQKIGFFNEKLRRSQDLEFNLRLKKAGGKILLAPNIISYYYPSSNIKDFLKHNFYDGVWAIYPLKFVKTSFKLRHYAPLIFVLSLLGTGLLGIFFQIFLRLFLLIIGLYFLANFYFSLRVAEKKKKFGYLFSMPIIFTIRHMAYGLGSAWGIFYHD